MKKLLLTLPVFAVSMAACAEPYLVLGYGYNTLSHDNTVSFSDGTGLKPDSSDAVWKAYVGYRFENNFGIEVGYNQFDADASKNRYLGVDTGKPGGIFGDEYHKEREWDAMLKAKQINVKPVYFYDVNDRLIVKAGLGLTYTEYKVTGSDAFEYESIKEDGPEYSELNQIVPGEYQRKMGVTTSLSVEYQIFQGLYLGAEASFSHDSVANTNQVIGTAAYHF
ncbi:AcfA family outer membrane beta-barrel protein [Parasalinivibrio latis]|uniref:AcfA family outer membrane beta-barrel protein n=1 Tax=Parasalinivibrio latis TaxID=2952610 RepID=UPI0030DEB817